MWPFKKKTDLAKTLIRIPNIDTFASLIDRLSIENHKVAVYENKKREEQSKKNPDPELITKWDNLSREANELRSEIKKRIDSLLEQIITTGKYTYMKEPRTFSPPAAEAFSSLIDKRYSEIGRLAAMGSLIDALENLLKS